MVTEQGLSLTSNADKSNRNRSEELIVSDELTARRLFQVDSKASFRNCGASCPPTAGGGACPTWVLVASEDILEEETSILVSKFLRHRLSLLFPWT